MGGPGGELGASSVVTSAATMAHEARELRRLRERDLKQRDKTRIRELRVRLREAKTARPRRIREIRVLCRIGRENVRARVKALRSETLDRLRETVAQLRQQQRDQCATGTREARARLTQQIDEARAELEAERRLFRSFYGRKPASRVRAAERRQESDDEVERNLPPELVPVFRRVKKTIKAGPRRSRTEAFLEWVEGNTDEAHAILYDQVESDVARMVAEHEQIAKRLRKGRAAYREPEHAAHALGVPF